MKKSTQPKHGGVRPGSGRKPLVEGDESVQFSGKIPGSMAESIEKVRGDKTRGDVLREALELWLKKHG